MSWGVFIGNNALQYCGCSLKNVGYILIIIIDRLGTTEET